MQFLEHAFRKMWANANNGMTFPDMRSSRPITNYFTATSNSDRMIIIVDNMLIITRNRSYKKFDNKVGLPDGWYENITVSYNGITKYFTEADILIHGHVFVEKFICDCLTSLYTYY